MPTYEGIRLKALKYNRKIFGGLHNKSLKTKQFTIISNNCWGGEVYEYYNLQKQSPTIGLFFMADDYIKFIKRLPEYLNADFTFIAPEESRWKSTPDICGDERFGQYPIGLLKIPEESIEVFFLHYHSEDEARSKWLRRCKRIKWDKLIVKFNDQNGCSDYHLKEFVNANYEHKLFFTVKDWRSVLGTSDNNTSALFIQVRQPRETDHILASYEPFGKSITNYINSI